MNRMVKWSRKEYSLPTRILLTLPAGLLFVFLIPYALIVWIPPLDSKFGFPELFPGPWNLVIGILLIGIGMFFGFSSNYAQFSKARGTPLPVMATQELLVSGVFHYCRNPMAFGTILAYFGISIAVGSICSILTTILFSALLITYIKKVEEKELEARFGEAYLIYKSRTPFMIPRLRSRNNDN